MLAGRRQALLPEHDQPADGRADQRDVGHPAPRRGDPAAGGGRGSGVARGHGGCGTATRPAPAGRPARPRRSGPPATRTATRPGPGVTATAAPTPTAAAGSTTDGTAAQRHRASCRSEAPRARIMVNSPSRCTATSRAPSSTTTAAIAARLTNSSDSTRCTASSVATKGGRTEARPSLRLIWIVADAPAAALRLGPHGRGRGQVGEALEDLQQPGRLVGRDTAQVEREAPQGAQRLGGRVALQGVQVGRTDEGGRAPEGHGIRRRVGQLGRGGDRVHRPEGRSGADGPDDPGDHHAAGRSAWSREPTCRPNRAAVAVVTATGNVARPPSAGPEHRPPKHRAWIRRPAARCGPARCGRAVRAGGRRWWSGAAGPHGERDRAGDHARTSPLRAGPGAGRRGAGRPGAGRGRSSSCASFR